MMEWEGGRGEWEGVGEEEVAGMFLLAWACVDVIFFFWRVG